jgi:serine/threonine protein kinase
MRPLYPPCKSRHAQNLSYNLPMSDWLGKTLGKVNIESLIARGGMAEIFLGTHSTLNKKVAVKVIRGQMDDDAETITRFQREAQVVASLRHPNIVQMLDYDFIDGQPYLVMEHVPGPSLAAYLRELHKNGKRLPLADISRLLNSLAGALDYAHSQNIVHRDIKPGNILLRSISSTVELNNELPDDVEPIITDFGLVRLLDSSIQTSTGTVSGTPAYMSPEQARGDKVGVLSDIYSVGVILYELLAGTVPFEADSTFGILMKHLNEPPPPIPGISSDLQAVVDRALAKDPELRFQSVGELASEFNAIFNGQTISPNTLKNAELVKKSFAQPSPAQPRVSWMWALVITVLIGLGAVIFFQLRSSAQTPVDDPNKPMGRVTYLDFNLVMDKVFISLTNVEPPASGTHYEVWFLGDGGETKQNIGKVEFDQSGQGQLTFIYPIDSEATNMLAMFNQVEVTREADNDPKPGEPGEVLCSSVFPPQAFIHLRHLLAGFENTPNQEALIQGLWTTADQVDTSAYELQQAYQGGDEALVRKKAEEIINQIVGDQNPDLYKDWDGDKTIDNPSDGYGLLENGGGKNAQGYIPNTISHAQFAMQASDATQNIIAQGEHVIISAQNMEARAKELLDKTQQLNEIPFDTEMESLVSEIRTLANDMLVGLDKNGDGIIDAVEGEGGADTVYESSYRMADMPLLRGAGRIPEPVATPQANP